VYTVDNFLHVIELTNTQLECWGIATSVDCKPKIIQLKLNVVFVK